MSETIIHKAKALTKEEVEANRSSKYEYIDFGDSFEISITIRVENEIEVG